jgi:hypothetical protein
MKCIVIFGAGGTGRMVLNKIKTSEREIFFTDSNRSLWGKEIQGVKVISPNEIPKINIGKIYVGTTMSPNRIVDYLTFDLSVPLDKIDTSFVALALARNRFVKNFA